MNPSSLPPVPISQSYWVIPGQFLAGDHPAALGEDALARRLQAMLRSGISVFYDLTEPHDGRIRYDVTLYREAADYGLGARYYNFPIPDFTAPTEEMVRSILDSIDQNLTAGRNIYVHCFAGIGRTGTIVGCYLARHGTTGQAALDELAHLRADIPSWFRRSPEASDQVDLVIHWKAGT